MPTVHCPSCHRALQLPESHPGGAARCPLCLTTFPTPSTQVPILSTPRAEPIFSIPSPGQPLEIPPRDLPDEPPARSEGPLPSPDVIEFLGRDSRESVKVAAGHLKTFAGLGAAYLFTCGCINEKWLGAALGFEWSLDALAVVMLLRVAMLLLIYLGAAAMERCRARGLALTSPILVLCLSSYILLWPLLVFYEWASSVRGVRPVAPGLAVVVGCGAPWLVTILALVVGGFGMWAGVHALRWLYNPEVVRAYRGEY